MMNVYNEIVYIPKALGWDEPNCLHDNVNMKVYQGTQDLV